MGEAHNKRAQLAAIAAGPPLRSGPWRGRYSALH